MERFRVICGPVYLRNQEANDDFLEVLVLSCDKFMQLQFVSTDFYW